MLVPYITLAEARAWLRLPEGADDPLLTTLIAIATEQLIEVMEQDVALQPTTETVQALGGRRLFVRRDPLVSASTVVVEGRTYAAAAEDGAVVRQDGGSFPAGCPVTATYIAGHAKLPELVKLACRQQVAALWNAPAFNPNVVGENVGGILQASFGPAGPVGVAPATAALVGPFKRRWVVA